jgi:transcriptional regulator with XRE-family HTH domain
MILTPQQAAEFRTVRRLAGLSQQAVSTKTKICRSRLSYFENCQVELAPHELNRVTEVVLAALQARAPSLVALVGALGMEAR